MELVKKELKYYDPIVCSSIHEERMDAIVPDSNPDILRVLDSSGIVCVRDKVVQGDSIEISGNVRVGVLYISEQGGVSHIDLNIPFLHSMDSGGASTKAELSVRAVLRGLDTHMLNSRKLSVKVTIGLECKAFEHRAVELTENVQAGDERLEILRRPFVTYVPKAVKCKTFNILEDQELPASKMNIAELLRSEMNTSGVDVKMMNNKAFIKGILGLKLLYRSDDNMMRMYEGELPFTQIVDLEGALEEDVCSVCFEPKSFEVSVKANTAGENRIVTCGAGLYLTATVFSEQAVDVISDIYSLTNDMEITSGDMITRRFVESSNKRVNCRERLDTELPVKYIIDYGVHVEALHPTHEGMRSPCCELSIVVIYVANDDMVYSARKKVTAVWNGEYPEGCDASVAASVFGEGAVVDEGGVECRFAVDFDCAITCNERLKAVSDVKAGEYKKHKSHVSTVLRFADGGEDFWELAKVYNSTMNDILEANKLTSDDVLEQGQLLLIPIRK